MKQNSQEKEYGFQTRAVHIGNAIDGETGAIKRPITMANSYALPYDPSELNWSTAGQRRRISCHMFMFAFYDV